LLPDLRKTGKPTSPEAPQRISPKHAAILVTRPADKINDEQQQLLDRMEAQCSEVIELRKISLGFRAALVADDSNQLRRWVQGPKHSEFGPVVRFAYGLQKGISAAAAVDTSWSTGQVEGQNNRLKMIKRQMYGRAGFELLRARVLPYSPAAVAGPAP
jgi:transposase